MRNRRWFLQPRTMPPNPLGELDQVGTNANRNHVVRPAGPIDPEICIIDVRTNRHKLLALIANYALHYVGGVPKKVDDNGREVGMASADYFGEFSRIMPFRVGGVNPPDNFVALMTNGASGDINNLVFTGTRAPRSPFEQIRIVASKAADASGEQSKKLKTTKPNLLIATCLVRLICLTENQMKRR